MPALAREDGDLRERWHAARVQALLKLKRGTSDNDYIQDPETGLLGGRYPGMGDDGIGPRERHPGEGYSPNSFIRHGVIHTNNVYDAVKALHEDRKVELQQPRQVTVLIDKLGHIAKEMVAKGGKEPKFNLCNVTVRGTNLFCADALGIERVKMPQIPKEQAEAFLKHLTNKGHAVVLQTESASHLRATQNQLSGAAVAHIATFLRNKPDHQSSRIVVSKDNYILDGHHRWAAKIGLDAEDNRLGDPDINIARVDIGITELLHEAETFTEGKGKVAMGQRATKPGRALTSKEIISEAGTIKPNSRRVQNIAKDLNDRAAKILQREVGVSTINLSNRTEVMDDYLAGVIAQELRDGLHNGHSAADWYDKSMRAAMATAAKIYPGMASDADKRFMFTAALAITSQGEVVDSSVRLADVAYKHFEKTGKFPEGIKTADPNIGANFKKVNAFIKQMGIARTREMFDKEMSVAELRDLTGYTVSGLGVEDRVYGSAVLGPKIGNGFFQNLNGNFKPITMDLWFMRSWGRITNTGIHDSDMTAQITRFTKALKGAGRAVPKTTAAKTKLAREILKRHEKRFAESKAYRDQKKTEIVLSAERYVYHHDGAMVEMPRGVGHRRWITSVFHKAIAKLKSEGITITPASAQATWWWPEKVLYDTLGAPVRELDMDYGKALQKLAESRGIKGFWLEELLFKALDYEQGLGSIPWVEDPDEPDYLTDAEIEEMARTAAKNFWPRPKHESVKALREKAVYDDYIQDPTTGRFTGSQSEGGDTGGGPKQPAKAPDKPVRVSSGKAWPKEDNGKATKGDEILVYRIGSEKGGLAGRNGGNANALAEHLVRYDDPDAPAFSSGFGNTVTAYRVKLTADPSKYVASVGGKPARGGTEAELESGVGRSVYHGKNDYVSVAYSFPASGAGYEHESLDSVPLDAVRAELKKMGYRNADDAGTLKTTDAIRAAFENKPLDPLPSPPHDQPEIGGLPSNIKIKDRLLDQAFERDAYTYTARDTGEKRYGLPRYEMTVTAKIPEGIENFATGRDGRGSYAYYNPKLADLKVFNKGEQYLERTHAMPKEGLKTKIEPLEGSGEVIYRGMRAEEYQKFLDTGKIESTGLYNLGTEQEGLTYWATDPSTAVSYANGFAPWPHKATFEKPAYVIAVRKPLPEDTRHVEGTGKNEVGVSRAMTKDEVVGVWRGEVYAHYPGEQDINPSRSNDDNEYEAGSGSAPSSDVVWQHLWQWGTEEEIAKQAAEDTARVHQYYKTIARETAEKNDFNPDNIDYTYEDKEFKLGEATYKYAGSYQWGSPAITLYMPQLTEKTIAGVTAHEIAHRKFDHLIRARQAEYNAMMADPGPPPNPDSEHIWERRGGTDAMMKADGMLRPPYDQKYPLYQEWERIQNMRPTLSETDGVSPYSRAYWEDWHKGGATKTDLATHETIAEMSKALTKWGRHAVDAKAPWKDLYALMENVWSKTPQETRDEWALEWSKPPKSKAA
jgi:hypothetical protein